MLFLHVGIDQDVKDLGRGFCDSHLLIHRDRFFRLSHLAVCLSKVFVQLGIFCTEIDRILIILDGLGRLLQLGIGKTEPSMNGGLPRARLHDLLVKGRSFAESFGLEIEIGQPLQGIRIIRFELHDFLILANSLLIPFPFFIGRPQIEMDHGIIRFQLDGFFIILDFLFHKTLSTIGQTRDWRMRQRSSAAVL